MTVALGFRCSGGVVLCSDSQISVDGGLKYSGPKIFSVDRPNADCQFALCYAGYPDIMELIYEKVREAFSAMPSAVDVDLRPIPSWNGTFRKKLEEILGEFYATHGTDRYAELLCAIQSYGEGVSLYKGTLTVVRPARTFEYMGTGDSSVVRFISDLMPRDLSIRQGLAVGCYMVAKATKYIDGCGSPIQALVIHDDGRTVWLGEKALDENVLLQEVEKTFGKEILKAGWPSALEEREGRKLFDEEEDD